MRENLSGRKGTSGIAELSVYVFALRGTEGYTNAYEWV